MSINLSEKIGDVTESVGDLVLNTSIPIPIKNNLIKALAQLCTGLVDIPVAHLEGIAAEIRAVTNARIQSINETGNQIAKQINIDEEYSKVAQKKHADKIVREQVNLDKISRHAIKEVEKKNSESKSGENITEVPDINLDWLNIFETEASKKSTEEMQLLFGKILAGEINQPSSFSLKTVKLISQIDSNTAQLFVNLCSICSSLRSHGGLYDSRAIALGEDAGNNALRNYGLGFDQLIVLQEYGLIIADMNSWRDYQYSITQANEIGTTFEFMNEKWELKPDDESKQRAELKLYGVALTRAGMELLKIIDIVPNEQYNDALMSYFRSMNLTMVKYKI